MNRTSRRQTIKRIRKVNTSYKRQRCEKRWVAMSGEISSPFYAEARVRRVLEHMEKNISAEEAKAITEAEAMVTELGAPDVV